MAMTSPAYRVIELNLEDAECISFYNYDFTYLYLFWNTSCKHYIHSFYFSNSWEYSSKESFKLGSEWEVLKSPEPKKEFSYSLAWLLVILSMLFNTWLIKCSICAFGRKTERHGMAQSWISKEKWWLCLSLHCMAFWREISLIFIAQWSPKRPNKCFKYLWRSWSKNMMEQKSKQANFSTWWKLARLTMGQSL